MYLKGKTWPKYCNNYNRNTNNYFTRIIKLITVSDVLWTNTLRLEHAWASCRIASRLTNKRWRDVVTSPTLFANRCSGARLVNARVTFQYFAAISFTDWIFHPFNWTVEYYFDCLRVRSGGLWIFFGICKDNNTVGSSQIWKFNKASCGGPDQFIPVFNTCGRLDSSGDTPLVLQYW